jgi:hypothetical protein
VNQASGDLIHFCKNQEEIDAFISEKRRTRPDGDSLVFIIEEDLRPIKRGERSAQFVVDRDYNVHFIGMTGQIIQRNEKGEQVVHSGNVISSDQNDAVNHLSATDRAALIRVVEYAAKKWRYQGYVGLDLIDTDDGIKILEANARLTGALPPYAILEQLNTKYDKSLSIVSINTLRPGVPVTTFEDLQKLLGDSLYSPGRGRGVIPVLFTTLPEKIGLAAVGENIQDAKMVMLKAAQCLQDTSGAATTW